MFTEYCDHAAGPYAPGSAVPVTVEFYEAGGLPACMPDNSVSLYCEGDMGSSFCDPSPVVTRIADNVFSAVLYPRTLRCAALHLAQHPAIL